MYMRKEPREGWLLETEEQWYRRHFSGAEERFRALRSLCTFKEKDTIQLSSADAVLLVKWSK